MDFVERRSGYLLTAHQAFWNQHLFMIPSMVVGAI